ncbi:MAG: S9 family peptidase [Gemmatimonadaceae bacterium]|nr:S9 family peptidase [Gemmatimonadaceae bacterium]
MFRIVRTAAAMLAATAILTPSIALAQRQQQVAPGRLSLDRIFRSADFRAVAVPSIAWSGAATYVQAVPNAAGGTDLNRVDPLTGESTPLVRADQLLGNDDRPAAAEDVTLSADRRFALVFHTTERVWRSNTRGSYTVVDLQTGRTFRTASRPGGQMFAKLSPDGTRVAFVRDNDLWVTELATGAETRLTTDGSETIINGTSDWVYEEELGLRDAFRWSPDGTRIAYWRFDQSAVKRFPLVDELTLYPTITSLRYPKAGETNSTVRVGVVAVRSGAATTWMDVGSGNDIYLARMEWAGNDSVVVQRLPRLQNRMDVLMASAATGGSRLVWSDTDSAYVDLAELRWIEDGRAFLALSDRSGWRQLYRVSRDGRTVRQLTRDGMDVLSVTHVDERGGIVYVSAAAPTPMERNIFRFRLDGRADGARITPERGSHTLNVSPDGRVAVHTHSRIDQPTTVTIRSFPSMAVRRTVTDNGELRARLATLDVAAPGFMKVPMPDGTQLDAYRIVPPGFDSTRAHPVLLYVYGGPAAPQVSDTWGGTRQLWFRMLAQEGYVVMAVDNRGAAWRGRDFRKVTQGRLGVLEADDQIDVARWLGSRSWADASRIGIWGWSYGGFLSSNVMFRGGDLFRAGIAVAPVTDWRFYDTIYTERFMRTPQENAAGYDAGSPVTHVAGLTGRFLLVHGTGDDNVHAQNSLVLADRLARAGKVFQMLMYPNRTHSISEGGITPQLYESLTRFILDNL